MERALSDFGDERFERIFSKVNLAIKAYQMNEMRALFIEFRLGNFGGLDFGLEPKLRLGDQFRRENYDQVAHMKSREGARWN